MAATFTFSFGGQDISAEFPDEVMAQIVDDVAATYGYRDQVPDISTPEARQARLMIPNPQSKTAFMLSHLVGHLNEIARACAIQRAREQAEAATAAAQLNI